MDSTLLCEYCTISLNRNANDPRLICTRAHEVTAGESEALLHVSNSCVQCESGLGAMLLDAPSAFTCVELTRRSVPSATMGCWMERWDGAMQTCVADPWWMYGKNHRVDGRVCAQGSASARALAIATDGAAQCMA
jgi:hypothetical protein